MEIIDASRLRLCAKDKKECKSELIEARWTGGFKCPACGHAKGYWLRKRELFECANRKCKKQTSPTAGTQFHNMKNLESAWNLLRSPESYQKLVSADLVREQTGMSYSGGKRLMRRLCYSLKFPIKRESCVNRNSILFLARSTRIQ
jgi:hypothetical protein